ncbi:Hypothetical predicted protein [Pelobates cultripes]|uniref:Uncharacterized protein n=1 Tax=Pelobates cultripes TaxID=61616 RepID=A0AAD1RHZ8_PELCU|nr:Hypothetical predicted protein [Pelobates cultripes]
MRLLRERQEFKPVRAPATHSATWEETEASQKAPTQAARITNDSQHARTKAPSEKNPYMQAGRAGDSCVQPVSSWRTQKACASRRKEPKGQAWRLKLSYKSNWT